MMDKLEPGPWFRKQEITTWNKAVDLLQSLQDLLTQAQAERSTLKVILSTLIREVERVAEELTERDSFSTYNASVLFELVRKATLHLEGGKDDEKD